MTNSDDAIKKDVNEATTAATTTTGSVAVNPDPPVDDVDGGDIIEHYTLDLIAISALHNSQFLCYTWKV